MAQQAALGSMAWWAVAADTGAVGAEKESQRLLGVRRRHASVRPVAGSRTKTLPTLQTRSVPEPVSS